MYVQFEDIFCESVTDRVGCNDLDDVLERCLHHDSSEHDYREDKQWEDFRRGEQRRYAHQFQGSSLRGTAGGRSSMARSEASSAVEWCPEG
jgi:hypothetical protein